MIAPFIFTVSRYIALTKRKSTKSMCAKKDLGVDVAIECNHRFIIDHNNNNNKICVLGNI